MPDAVICPPAKVSLHSAFDDIERQDRKPRQHAGETASDEASDDTVGVGEMPEHQLAVEPLVDEKVDAGSVYVAYSIHAEPSIEGRNPAMSVHSAYTVNGTTEIGGSTSGVNRAWKHDILVYTPREGSTGRIPTSVA